MFAVLACTGPAELTYPSGLEPLEANVAPWPEASATELSVVTVEEEAGHWAYHARGYIAADLETTWDALQVDEVVLDRREVASWTSEYGIDDTHAVSFVLHETIDNVISFDMDVEWRQGVASEDSDGPTVVAARWEKTEGGEVIDLMISSIELTAEGESLTGISIVEYIDVLQGGAGPAESYNADLLASLQAFTQGQPLPSYSTD